MCISLCVQFYLSRLDFVFLEVLLTSHYRHGKDYKLIVWKFSEEDEPTMSVVLPVDTPPEPRKQPWLLHILMVNTMNFCPFAQCTPVATAENPTADDQLLIAVPNTKSSETVRFSPCSSEPL